MKKTFVSTVILGLALSFTACNKDKKDAAKAEPAKVEPAAAAPATPPAGEAKTEDKPKEEPAKGGW